MTDGSSTIKFKSLLVCHCSDFVFSKGNTSNVFSCVIAITTICPGSTVKIADYRLQNLPKICNPRLKHPPGGRANFAPYAWWSSRSLAHMYFILYLPFITRLWESLNDVLKSHWPLRCFSKPLLCFSAHLWRQMWPARKTNKQKIKLVHWQWERSRLFLVCSLRIRKSTLMKKMALEWDTVHGALVYSCLTCLSATDLWHVETMAVCVKSLALHPLDTVYC